MTKACHLVGILKQIVENCWLVSSKPSFKGSIVFTGLPGFIDQFQKHFNK